MRAQILIGLLTAHAPAVGQAGTQGSRWAIGASASVDRCFRTLINAAGDETRAGIIRFRNEHETYRIGFTGGIEATYALDASRERWLISTGLQFSDRGYRFEDELALISTDPLDPAIPGSTLRLDYRDHYRYLSLPLMLHFSLGGRWRFEPSIGLWGDLFLGQTNVQRRDFNGIVQTSRVKDNLTEFRPVGATACVEVCTRLRLNELWSVRAGMRGRYQLTALADTPIEGYLWEAGFQLGLQYHFP